MLSEKKKNRIRSLTQEEMQYEINLGNRSKFQKEAFAYLQCCYQLKMIELTKIPYPTPEPPANDANKEHNWYDRPIGKVGIGLVIVILGSMALWVINHYLNLELNP